MPPDGRGVVPPCPICGTVQGDVLYQLQAARRVCCAQRLGGVVVGSRMSDIGSIGVRGHLAVLCHSGVLDVFTASMSIALGSLREFWDAY